MFTSFEDLDIEFVSTVDVFNLHLDVEHHLDLLCNKIIHIHPNHFSLYLFSNQLSEL